MSLKNTISMFLCYFNRMLYKIFSAVYLVPKSVFSRKPTVQVVYVYSAGYLLHIGTATLSVFRNSVGRKKSRAHSIVGFDMRRNVNTCISRS